MRLTTKGRFAVTAMIDVALRETQGPVALAAIAFGRYAAQVVPIPPLAATVGVLVLVGSVQFLRNLAVVDPLTC